MDAADSTDLNPDADDAIACPECARERQRRRLRRQLQDDEQLVKQMRLNIIKQQILDRLGLKQRPNITADQPRPAIPEPLLRDMDLQASQHHEEEQNSKPTEVVTFGTPSKCLFHFKKFRV